MHGRMLLYQGKAHDAEVEVRQALVRYPDQFKLLAFLGDFLYYQGKTEEAERELERASQLSGPRGEDEPPVISAFIYASRGQRDRIEPGIFRHRREEVVDGDLSDQSQLFRGDGENEIRVRLGKIKQFLFPFHQTESGHTARRDCDQRLDNVEAKPLRVGVGIQESQDAVFPVRHVKDQEIKRQQRGRERVSEVAQED